MRGEYTFYLNDILTALLYTKISQFVFLVFSFLKLVENSKRKDPIKVHKINFRVNHTRFYTDHTLEMCWSSPPSLSGHPSGSYKN